MSTDTPLIVIPMCYRGQSHEGSGIILLEILYLASVKSEA